MVTIRCSAQNVVRSIGKGAAALTIAFSDAPDAADLRSAAGGDVRPVVARPAKGRAQRGAAEGLQLSAGDGGTLPWADSGAAAEFRVCACGGCGVAVVFVRFCNGTSLSGTSTSARLSAVTSAFTTTPPRRARASRSSATCRLPRRGSPSTPAPTSPRSRTSFSAAAPSTTSFTTRSAH